MTGNTTSSDNPVTIAWLPPPLLRSIVTMFWLVGAATKCASRDIRPVSGTEVG